MPKCVLEFSLPDEAEDFHRAAFAASTHFDVDAFKRLDGWKETVLEIDRLLRAEAKHGATEDGSAAAARLREELWAILEVYGLEIG